MKSALIWMSAFGAVLLISLIGAPATPFDLFLHHIPTVLFLGWLLREERRGTFDETSRALIYGFLLIHVLGARYLYSDVPYDAWSQSLLGWSPRESFGWTRNHYDRFVHLAFGVLMLRPAWQILAARLPARPSRLLLAVLAISLIVVAGTLYELLEWAIAIILSPETAEHYNGQQGDPWDAQKDMAIALAGAVCAAVVVIWKGVEP